MKGALSQDTARLMVFKLVMAASKTWRRLRGQNQLPKVIDGVKFKDGIEEAADTKSAALFTPSPTFPRSSDELRLVRRQRRSQTHQQRPNAVRRPSLAQDVRYAEIVQRGGESAVRLHRSSGLRRADGWLDLAGIGLGARLRSVQPRR